MAEQLESLDATALLVEDLAVPCELDLLLVDAKSLAQVIQKECIARKKAILEEMARCPSAQE